MQKIVWVFFLASFLLTPTAFADMWDNTLSDFEMFNQQLQYDSDALSVEQEAALLNESTDLFPLTEEEEESSKADNYSQSDTHVTIKVNGVPVILDDVPAFEWFASYVRDAAERGIVSGYKQANGLPSGKYGPADNVTIAQLAKMAVIAASIDTYGCLNEIQNEPATQDWSAPYIRCAENEGWAVYSDGTVDIFRPATRAEVVVTVLQAFKQRISPRSGTIFEDVGTSVTYGAAIETAANAGVVSGYSDSNGNPTGFFGPSDPVNRAETAKIFSLSFQVY